MGKGITAHRWLKQIEPGIVKLYFTIGIILPDLTPICAAIFGGYFDGLPVVLASNV
jgi:hypothetical protein